MELTAILNSIYQTLNQIEVKGKSNVEKLYCSIVALENLIENVKQAENDIKTEEGEVNG